MKKLFSILFALVLVLSFSLVMAVPATAAILKVGPGETYTTIQDAVNAASGGDTILVAAGTYDEEVTVDVAAITVKGESLSAIVDGGFWLRADNITIDGLTIENGYGFPATTESIGIIVTVPATSGHMLINNEFVGPAIYDPMHTAINFGEAGSSGVTVDNNKIHGWRLGIYLGSNAHSNTITNNEIYDNLAYGIGWYQASNNDIMYNDIHDNVDGVVGYLGTGNVVNYNNIYGNTEQGVDWWAGEDIDATHNWWGDKTGPQHATNPSGTGDPVSDNVDYIPWLTGPWIGGTQVGMVTNILDIVAISVSPSSIDFGTLYPGSTSSVEEITVGNIGTQKVDVDAEVKGTDLFKTYLEMRDSTSWSVSGGDNLWPSIVTNLAMGASDVVKTKLPVPTGYTPSGTETGRLVFEATAK